MTNLTVAYAVDFRADFFTDAAPGLAARSEDFWRLPRPILSAERNRSENLKEGRSVLYEKCDGQMARPEERRLHTVRFLTTRRRGTGRWRS